MRIGNPSSNVRLIESRYPIEGRSPLIIDGEITVVNDVPGATVNRLTYDVPAGRQAVISGLHATIYRTSAAGVLGNILLWASLLDDGLATRTLPFKLNHQDNAVPSRSQISRGGFLWMGAGYRLKVDSLHNGTGGLVDYYVQMDIIEFDA